MLAKIFSCAITGIDAKIVEVELDVSRGVSSLIMVGLPDQAIKESRDRVKSAILNSCYQFPTRRIVINLAPAELRKEGAIYDLPIALGLLLASNQFKTISISQYLVLGELALDGKVRPIRGVLAAAITAKQQGFKGIIIPEKNLPEAIVLTGDLQVIGVSSLQDAVGFFTGKWKPHPKPQLQHKEKETGQLLDFLDVNGHESLKRALTVAAAGAHNVIMIGPPGSGKTMCAKRIPTILPELSYAESLETTKIFSIAGGLKPGSGLKTSRPFRSPHHSISAAGLIGGGSNPRPGEVSLSHNGVLFLDEAAEFSRPILEMLRQPLEDGVVTISRAAGSATYPARMMLVVSQNMCPCGRRGDLRKNCRCTPRAINAYLDKLSGPLLDRIDIHVEVPALTYAELRSDRQGQNSATMRQQVVEARNIQKSRFPGQKSPVNAQMSEKELKQFCQLDQNCESLLKIATDELGFSARAHARILKLSRTIADLEKSKIILAKHISEAIGYRNLDRNRAY